MASVIIGYWRQAKQSVSIMSGTYLSSPIHMKLSGDDLVDDKSQYLTLKMYQDKGLEVFPIIFEQHKVKQTL